MNIFLEKLQNLRKLSQQDEDRAILLLLKIFRNILENPNEPKYRHLNAKRISNWQFVTDMLLHCGFVLNDNQTKLQFVYTQDHLRLLSNIKNNLDTKITNKRKKKDIDNTWECLSCTFRNKVSRQYCEVCGDANALQMIESSSCVNACNTSAQHCKWILSLKNILNNEIMVSDCIVDILNKFNHMLTFHNNDNEEYEMIYNLFGGECDLGKCNKIKRCDGRKQNNKNPNGKINDEDSRTSLCISEIVDKIHCFTSHGYHVGFRLNRNDRRRIAEIKNNIDKNRNNHIVDDNNFLARQKILRARFSTLRQLSINRRNIDHNKYSTDLHQVEPKGSVSKVFTAINDKYYSYSFPFFYKNQFDDRGRFNTRLSDGYKYWVPKKYSSLKAELLTNKIWAISESNWALTTTKVHHYIQTDTAKRLTAKTQGYATYLKNSVSHPKHFGYPDGHPITLSHLIALYLYCSDDELQFKFSQTYRKVYVEETVQDVIERHCNYHHFAKYLKEAIQVFGNNYWEGFNGKVYHGINKQMLFDQTFAVINGPLSTSIDENVAIQFSRTNGLVLELIPQSGNKYFVCDWISSFSSEREVLMGFGTVSGGLHFQNIKTSVGSSYIRYIPMLRMIETMVSGWYFMYDPADIIRLSSNGRWDKRDRNVKKNNLRLLDLIDNQIFGILICHQLARNEYIEKYTNIKQRSKYIKLYTKVMNPIPFIENLLNKVCQKKTTLRINMNTMYNEILDECSHNIIDGDGGYIGYSKWKWLFMNQEKDIIDLSVFYGLFPNVTNIKITQLSCINSTLLDYIASFLMRNLDSNIRYIQLHLSKSLPTDIFVNFKILCGEFKSKFGSIGFRMRCDIHDVTFGTMNISIYK